MHALALHIAGFGLPAGCDHLACIDKGVSIAVKRLWCHVPFWQIVALFAGQRTRVAASATGQIDQNAPSILGCFFAGVSRARFASQNLRGRGSRYPDAHRFQEITPG
jgi:hypothetical protein